MARFKDLTGQKFGRLTVAEKKGTDNRGEVLWVCECVCGEQSIVLGGNLRSGHSKSCGCLKGEVLRGKATTHGMSRSRVAGKQQARIYGIWADMKRRCLNPNKREYKWYGGRGITVCDEWQEFQPFYFWAIQNGYADNLTIERKDNDGNYGPGNCEWIPLGKQALNTTKNVRLTYDGRTMTMTEWSQEKGLGVSTLWNRLRNNWDLSLALETPINGIRNGKAPDLFFRHNGKDKSLKDWSRMLGVKYATLYRRIMVMGWSPEKALTEPVRRGSCGN